MIKITFKRDIRRNNWSDIITGLHGHDCASRGYPRPRSAAFCIRVYSGSLIMAKGFKIQDTSNLVAKARAIREGLFLCKEHHLSHVIIETGSMAMVQILEGRWDVPWTVTLEVNSINCLRRSLSASVHHIFREGNTLTNYFANLVFDFVSDYQFIHFQDTPMEGWIILNLDKSGTPHIRRRLVD
ncbi:hypothetical protein KY284_030075 [Solanum tuberosum]|nr:hypothetical protein KY284_030075 [Solanum tuberosum]